jgi:tyrosyl-tRNA synthetase
VEFGGIDQKFNCLVGRELQVMMGQPPQQVFLVPLLLGTDGKQKMSKSLDNYIGITEPPDEMYGKVMSIPDSLILNYFELLTDIPDEELVEFDKALQAQSVNPMELKKKLAWEIVAQFHSPEQASEAEASFERIFQRGELPEEAPQFSIPTTLLSSGKDFLDLLVYVGLVSSRSEGKRQISQGAVEINGKKVTDRQEALKLLKDDVIIKVGKHRFAQLKLK